MRDSVYQLPPEDNKVFACVPCHLWIFDYVQLIINVRLKVTFKLYDGIDRIGWR